MLFFVTVRIIGGTVYVARAPCQTPQTTVTVLRTCNQNQALLNMSKINETEPKTRGGPWIPLESNPDVRVAFDRGGVRD